MKFVQHDQRCVLWPSNFANYLAVLGDVPVERLRGFRTIRWSGDRGADPAGHLRCQIRGRILAPWRRRGGITLFKRATMSLSLWTNPYDASQLPARPSSGLALLRLDCH